VVQYLTLDPSAATFLLGFFAVAFIAFSVPARIIGDRIGRLKAIRLGGAVTLAVFASVSYIRAPMLYRALLIVGGLGWALVITNAYPFLVDRVPPRQTGTFTGLWNAALALAGLISPPVYGLVVDTFGFGAFFIPGVVFMAAGCVWYACAWRCCCSSSSRQRTRCRRRPVFRACGSLHHFRHSRRSWVSRSR